MQRGKGLPSLFRPIQTPVILVTAKIGQAVSPSPRVIARKARPILVVLRLAAHVDHAVDAGAAAHHLAARIAQYAPVQAGVGLGLVEPIGARVADAIQIAHRNMNPVVVVLPTGLDQQHALVRVGAETIGQQATGRAGADDDVVKDGFTHGGQVSLAQHRVPAAPQPVALRRHGAGRRRVNV